jgi:hypothetical protein
MFVVATGLLLALQCFRRVIRGAAKLDSSEKAGKILAIRLIDRKNLSNPGPKPEIIPSKTG